MVVLFWYLVKSDGLLEMIKNPSVYKVSYFTKSDREEYQVLKRGRKYHGCEEKYNIYKREIGSNIIFLMILRLLGRIFSGEGGKNQD